MLGWAADAGGHFPPTPCRLHHRGAIIAHPAAEVARPEEFKLIIYNVQLINVTNENQSGTLPMTALLVFAMTLLAAVLVSDLADRSVLSTAVLFLLAGVVAGDGVLGAVSLRPDDPAVAMLAELALFSVLFTDGMRVGLSDLASAWQLPGRALLLGLPLTLLGTAFLAHWVAGLPWAESFLIGAVLSPTDPVFAAAIVGTGGGPRPAPAAAERRERAERRPGAADRRGDARRRRLGAVQPLGGAGRDRVGGRHRRGGSLGRHPAGAGPILLGPRRLPAAERLRDRPAGALHLIAGPRQRVPRRLRGRDHGGDRRAPRSARPSTSSASWWPSC